MLSTEEGHKLNAKKERTIISVSFTITGILILGANLSLYIDCTATCFGAHALVKSIFVLF